MESYVLNKLKESSDFAGIGFLDTTDFKHLLSELSETTTKSELQDKLLEMSKILKSNTTLNFVSNDIPMIWDNWGLNASDYRGSGGGPGTKFGFNKRILPQSVNIFSLLANIFTYGSYYMGTYRRDIDSVWNKSFNDMKEQQQQRVAYKKIPYSTKMLGELWLKLLPPEKLKQLQIRFISNKPFDIRSDQEKNSLPLDSVITSNLLPLALQLAAEYNVAMKEKTVKEKDKEPKDKKEKEVAEEEKKKEEDEVSMAAISAADARSSFTMTEPIYFEHTGDRFGNVVISAPRSRVLSVISRIFTATSPMPPEVEALRMETSELVFARLNLRTLTEKLEELISERRPVPYTSEERGDFMEESFARVLIEERRKEITKSMGEKR